MMSRYLVASQVCLQNHFPATAPKRARQGRELHVSQKRQVAPKTRNLSLHITKCFWRRAFLLPRFRRHLNCNVPLYDNIPNSPTKPLSATTPKRVRRSKELCIRASSLKLPKPGSFRDDALIRRSLTASPHALFLRPIPTRRQSGILLKRSRKVVNILKPNLNRNVCDRCRGI